ncbi:MAG: TatD family hydrolase [Bacillota bacterium]|nr:TatD family hydrolase [Bacillota bacterium]
MPEPSRRRGEAGREADPFAGGRLEAGAPARGPLFDAHAHLADPALAGERQAVLERARQAGLLWILDSGTSLEDSQRALARRGEAAGVRVEVAVGVHPHEAAGAPPDWPERLRGLARRGAVAIGEIGLDYHYDRSPRPVQREALRRQLELARELDLPVVLHEREAHADLLAILDQTGLPPRGGVIHSFSGGPGEAEAYLGRGLFLGVSGMVTFRRADALRQAIREAPAERLLYETDSPYLAPHPLRGRRNEPAHVAWTVAAVAELRGEPAAELLRAAWTGLARLYGAPLPERPVRGGPAG